MSDVDPNAYSEAQGALAYPYARRMLNEPIPHLGCSASEQHLIANIVHRKPYRMTHLAKRARRSCR